MTLPNPAKRPIIVKRRKEHHEEHSGQWKVAYADFVTAMMAFFLIMWLLASTTPTERETIARYFSTSSIVALPAGTGVLSGGPAVMSGAEPNVDRLRETTRKVSALKQVKAAPKPPSPRQMQHQENQIEHQRFEAVKSELEQMMRDGALKAVSDNLAVEVTPEGLRVQIFDRDGEAMFATGSAEPTPRLAAILQVIAQVLNTVQNPVILTGHTDSEPLRRAGYTNWELSSDRANSVRRVLQADGLGPGRILDVEGRAATDPLIPDAPDDPRNRRIAVTILRSAVASAMRSDAQPDADPAHN